MWRVYAQDGFGFSLFFSTAACHAEGYIEIASNNTDTHLYAGWACDPQNPYEPATVHIWSDGVFLGALALNVSREPAVGQICGGNSARGFHGSIAVPEHMRNWTWRDVSITYVGARNIALQNSPVNVFFGSEPAPKPRTMTIENCGQPRPSTDWILVDRKISGVCSTKWIDENSVELTRGYVDIWAYAPDMPVNFEVMSCQNLYPNNMNFVILKQIERYKDCHTYVSSNLTTWTTGYRIKRIQ